MQKIDKGRRLVLKQGSASVVMGLFVAAGLVKPGAAFAAWNQTAFSAKGVEPVVKALGGASPAASKDVSWGSTPEIAENGAVVPFTFGVIMPTNHKLLAPGRDLASEETRALLVQWGKLHAVRTALSLAGTVIYLCLLLQK